MTRMNNEKSKERIFEICKIDRLAIDLNLIRSEVDAHIINGDKVIRR